jgi:glycyl-tRNA synthetase alpha subunit
MPQDQTTPRSFQEIILRLQAYWAAQGLRHPAAL